MKHRFIFTPYGIVIALLAIGLLAGAVFVKNEVVSNIMIGMGLFTIATGWIRTYWNIKRHNRIVDESEKQKRIEVERGILEENREFITELRKKKKGN